VVAALVAVAPVVDGVVAAGVATVVVPAVGGGVALAALSGVGALLGWALAWSVGAAGADSVGAAWRSGGTSEAGVAGCEPVVVCVGCMCLAVPEH
jgi:hypothetical protein